MVFYDPILKKYIMPKRKRGTDAWYNKPFYKWGASKRRRYSQTDRFHRGHQIQYRPGGSQFQELKTKTIVVTGFSPISTAASFMLINDLIVQGTSPNERIGSVTCIKSISIRVCVTSGVGDLNQCYRMMLLWDKQPNGALAVTSDVLEGAGSWSSNSFFEMDSRDRFKILMNKQFSMGSLDSSDISKYYEFYSKANLNSIYVNNTGGGIAQITSGALILMIIADQATNTAFFNVRHRIRFVDSKGKGEPKIWARTVKTNMV